MKQLRRRLDHDLAAGHAVAVVSLRFDGMSIDPLALDAVQRQLAGVREGDVVVPAEHGHFWLLLRDTRAGEALAVASRVAERVVGCGLAAGAEWTVAAASEGTADDVMTAPAVRGSHAAR